jgi:cytochrome c peroxidase
MRHAMTILAISGIIALSAPAAYPHSNEPHSGGGGDVSRSSGGRLDYDPPPPGSYRLPPIQKATDGMVFDAEGKEHNLFALMTDRYVLLSFIYTGCYDPKGCPLAIHTLDTVREKLEKDPAVSGKVLLLTLSFDPEHDTPEVMREFAEARGFADSRKRRKWLFLTTSSKSRLWPILDGYGQYVVREYDKTGRHTGGYSHVLKVFLIDPDRNVRNIYSTSFLFPQLIVNDIKTLIGEETGVR